MNKLKACPMCGSVVTKRHGRLYRYDNGMVFFEYVCPNCANQWNLHVGEEAV
jgi:transposase-like protein